MIISILTLLLLHVTISLAQPNLPHDCKRKCPEYDEVCVYSKTGPKCDARIERLSPDPCDQKTPGKNESCYLVGAASQFRTVKSKAPVIKIIPKYHSDLMDSGACSDPVDEIVMTSSYTKNSKRWVKGQKVDAYEFRMSCDRDRPAEEQCPEYTFCPNPSKMYFSVCCFDSKRFSNPCKNMTVADDMACRLFAKSQSYVDDRSWSTPKAVVISTSTIENSFPKSSACVTPRHQILKSSSGGNYSLSQCESHSHWCPYGSYCDVDEKVCCLTSLKSFGGDVQDMMCEDYRCPLGYVCRLKYSKNSIERQCVAPSVSKTFEGNGACQKGLPVIQEVGNQMQYAGCVKGRCPIGTECVNGFCCPMV